TDTLGSVFDHIFASADAKVAVVVRGTKAAVGDGRNLVPASVLDDVRRVPGVAAAEGSNQGYAQLVDKHGKAYPHFQGPPALGFNYDPNSQISSIDFVSGHGPRASDEIAIDEATANATGYRVGDEAPVLSLLPRQPYRIVGIFTVAGNVNEGGASLTLFTQQRAQEIFAQQGKFETISVAAAPGVNETELRDRIGAVLPSGTQAITGSQQATDSANQIKQGLSFFNIFLLVFAAVALFVGAFIIFNTFSMLVAQRQREMAMLRSLGASRGQLVTSVLLEAGAVGAVAATIGIGVGLLIAIGLRALIGHVGGGPLPNGSLVLAPRTFIAAYVVGVIVTTVSAFVPGRRAARVPPVAALQESQLADVPIRRSAITGTVLLVIGIAALVPGLRGALLLLGLGAVAIFLGVAALSPLFARPVVAFLGEPLRRRIPGALGRRNAMRNPRRTSATAGALMVGLALVSAVSILGASLKTSTRQVINQTFIADLDVQSSSGQGLTPGLAQELAAAPGVGRSDALSFADALVGGTSQTATALPGGAIGRTVSLQHQSGSFDLRPGTMLVASDTAQHHHWHVGEALTVQYARGVAHPLTIAGIYKVNNLAGSVLVDQNERVNFPDQLDAVILLKAKPGTSLGALTATVKRIAAPYPNATVQTRTQFINSQLQQVDALLNLVTALLGLSVAIAVLGIVNTLALSVIERTRELGLLRAVGLSRLQLRRMVRTESVIVSVYGAVLGTVVGVFLGVAVCLALRSRGLTALTFPVGRMLVFILVAAVAGVIAAIWPARRAARLDVLQAIASE
ncbi:MAG TPA: ABC transporter permease, partial [Acidimicrobiales bacterium]|nr:ABC transporter permease [Acidimicrobiales bacterium]